MEFVHDDFLDIGLGAFTQGDVGEDFRRAAQNRRVAVDGGVAGAEADVFRPEFAAEGEPFFVDKGLDRAGINRAFPPGQRLELRRRRHKRFSRAGGRVEDDVLVLEQLQDGGFLGGVEPQAAALDIIQEPAQQRVVAAAAVAGDQIIKGRRHTGW
jgi:hypothetical protein